MCHHKFYDCCDALKPLCENIAASYALTNVLYGTDVWRMLRAIIKVTHLFSLVACIEVITAGTSPEPLASLHQDPWQGVHTNGFSQELVVASARCTSECALGAFTWLNVLFFEAGDSIRWAGRPILKQVFLHTLQDRRWIEDQVVVDGCWTGEAVCSLLSSDTCITWAKNPYYFLKRTAWRGSSQSSSMHSFLTFFKALI